MTRFLPTVSSLQRAMACSASLALPQLDSDKQTPASKRGSIIGAVIASELRGWPMPDVGRHRLKIDMAVLRAFLGDGDVRCEVAMSLRPDGAVEDLGENIGRSYERPGCINGAADIVVARRKALVVDVKSGSYPVPDPVDNWQVASLSSMLAVVLDGSVDSVESVTGVIAKLGRDGEWDFGTPKTWSLVELAGIRGRLLARIDKWRDDQVLFDAGLDEPERVQGSQCFWCRARCPHGRAAQKHAETIQPGTERNHASHAEGLISSLPSTAAHGSALEALPRVERRTQRGGLNNSA